MVTLAGVGWGVGVGDSSKVGVGADTLLNPQQDGGQPLIQSRDGVVLFNLSGWNEAQEITVTQGENRNSLGRYPDIQCSSSIQR